MSQIQELQSKEEQSSNHIEKLTQEVADLVAENQRLHSQSIQVLSIDSQGAGQKQRNDLLKLVSMQEDDQQSSSAEPSIQIEETKYQMHQQHKRSVSPINQYCLTSQISPMKKSQIEVSKSSLSNIQKSLAKNSRPTSPHKIGTRNYSTAQQSTIQEHVRALSFSKQFNLREYYEIYIRSDQILKDIYSNRYGQFAEIDPHEIKEKCLKIPDIFAIIQEQYNKKFIIPKEALIQEGQIKEATINALNQFIVMIFMKPELHQNNRTQNKNLVQQKTLQRFQLNLAHIDKVFLHSLAKLSIFQSQIDHLRYILIDKNDENKIFTAKIQKITTDKIADYSGYIDIEIPAQYTTRLDIKMKANKFYSSEVQANITVTDNNGKQVAFLPNKEIKFN
ncbi:hypothetical protein FGO68_gene16620 [Halteria grandinella]|uniref:Uncharacterized protein n=1 Tax=Halteria grandinella TaxID=5974 RepID=A0A8J8SXL3_HALGN|nr:hypothetical protein FGO68_gene16620 [Halteria grandinella]